MSLPLTQIKRPEQFNTVINDGLICLALIAVIAVTISNLLMGFVQ